MKQWFLAVALLAGLVCQAQTDPDMTDTRSKRESFLKLGLRDLRAEIASFAVAGIGESVGTLPLDKITHTSLSPTAMTFAGGTIRASIQLGPFAAAKHKLLYDEKYLVKIDKKTYYGGYGKEPVSQIDTVMFFLGTDTVRIPREAYNDLYNLKLSYKDKKGRERTMNGVYVSKNKRTFYFYLYCQDNTGSYEVTWIIQDKKYLRRVLDYDLIEGLSNN